MNTRRVAASFNVEFWYSLRRPLFITLAIILAVTAFGLSSGKMQISSGDTSVGGTKAWITSEFAQTHTMSYVVLLFYAFFIAAAAGLTLLKDRETKVDVLLHSTPLTPGEYVWGRFLAVLSGFLVLMVWRAACNAFFNHAVPNASANEIRGPFSAVSYLLPVLSIGLPFVVFYTGVSIWVGERTRNAVLVFALPVAMLLVCAFFLWEWAPSWLGLRVNRVLQVIEPTGYRWLNETYLKVDRGVEFYNTSSVPYTGLYWLNRLWLLGLGLAGVVMTQRSVARSIKGDAVVKPSRWKLRARARAVGAAPAPAAVADISDLRALGMTSRATSLANSVRLVAAAEMRELLRQAGLYIFVPVILLQTLGSVLFAVGAFDTPLLLTPGTTAVAAASQTNIYVCFLLMFYTVESLERERSTRFAPILLATPLRTGALLAGKALANTVVVGVILLAAFAGCVIALLVQHTVPFSITPYLLVWGLLLVPTFLAWTAFVVASYSATGNRYAAYSVCLAVMIFSGYKAVTGAMNWAGNWALWGAARWSDLGFVETDRTALVWNRVAVLGLAVMFMVLAVRLFERRGRDAVGTMNRLAPRRVFASLLPLAPYAAVPATALVIVGLQVNRGVEGGEAKKAKKDYWSKNLKTWYGAALPDIARADIRVKLDPARHWIESSGEFTLVNPLDSALAQIPLTGGLHWKNLSWTMNGADYVPEDSQHLYVFSPPRPIARGDSVVVGWRFDGRFPDGVTRNGGNTQEFILPSGVVLTGFTPSFAPVLGFQEDIGETKDNRTEPRRYPRDYWRGLTRATYGATAWFPARIEITGPEAYTLNSVGVCTSDRVEDGWRTQVWETDHPVKILNIVCGRWLEKRGVSTTIYYNEKHGYNVEEMSSTLDAARTWYSRWFMDYPWRELKLSEFPGLAGYAQGFGTNITFSENIGFLTRNTAKSDATFLVTAHEAAHQWWGNILTPAIGPGGDILSEGTAHFSTLLLFEQVKGSRGRMEFAKGIEDRYCKGRRPNEERAMYDVDGKRPSDDTVIYDRGGWVFWMLYDYLGGERAMAAYRNFFQIWSRSRDHPVLQDFVAAMRPYAENPEHYDAFVRQWFEDKAMPQYALRRARKEPASDGYDVTVIVENVGTGVMAVDVAATAGERWKKPDDSDTQSTYTPHPDYHDARGRVMLGAGESKTLTIHCDFDPERVVVDPDVRVLQLQRKQATATL